MSQLTDMKVIDKQLARIQALEEALRKVLALRHGPSFTSHVSCACAVCEGARAILSETPE